MGLAEAARPPLQIADLGLDRLRLGLGLVDGEALRHAGPFVAGVVQPGILEDPLPLADEFEQGLPLRLSREISVAGRGRFEGVVAGAPVLEQGSGDEPVSVGVHVDAVARELEARILRPAGVEGLADRAVDVDDRPPVGLTSEQPVGVAAEHFVVADVGLFVFVQAGGEGPGLDGLGVEDRGRQMEDVGPGGLRLGSEELDTLAVGGEPLLAEWVVDAVVHAVAGDDEVGLRLREDPVEPLVQVRPGEGPAGVAGLAQARDRFARQADVEELGRHGGVPEPQGRLDVFDVLAGVRDAIAEEDDPSVLRRRLVGGDQACGLEEDETETEERGASHRVLRLRLVEVWFERWPNLAWHRGPVNRRQSEENRATIATCRSVRR